MIGFVLFVGLLGSTWSQSNLVNHPDQHVALHAFFDAIGCNLPGVCPRIASSAIYNSTFIQTSPLGVVGISIPSRALSGTLPSIIAKLSQLTRILLFENLLHSTIPPQLGLLTALNSLSLRDNLLSGSLPSLLANATMVTALSDSTISRRFTSNSNSPTLSTAQNNRLTGTVPTEFAVWRQLTLLRLYNNSLVGRIPKVGVASSAGTACSFQEAFDTNCLECNTIDVSIASRCTCTALSTCVTTTMPPLTLPSTVDSHADSLSLGGSATPTTTGTPAGPATTAASLSVVIVGADSSDTAAPTDNTTLIAAVAGGAGGGFLLIIVAIVCVAAARRRRRAQRLPAEASSAGFQSARASSSTYSSVFNVTGNSYDDIDEVRDTAAY